jgi:hypothetical protein
MKRSLIAVSLLVAMLNACGVRDSDEYRTLAKQNDSLSTQLRNRDQQLDAIALSMDEIETNLAEIEKHELAIGNLKREGQLTQQDKISDMIKNIDAYIEDNRKKVSHLEEKLKESNNASAGLKRMVAQLKKNIAEKEEQITDLRRTVAVLEVEKDSLNYTIYRKDTELASKDFELTSNKKTLEETEVALTTAFYKIGSRKELVESGIIQKEGGVLGMGRTLTLANQVNAGNFNRISTKETQEIDLGITKKRNVISSHPVDSYYFSNSNGRVYLTIADKQKFWSVSKYLVVETDN